MRDRARAEVGRTSIPTAELATTCGNNFRNVLGVKGSWVQIPRTSS